MKLDVAAVPDAAVHELNRGLRMAARRATDGQHREMITAPGGGEPTRTAVPHEVFSVEARQLKDENWLSSAKKVGLRYFGLSGGPQPEPEFVVQIAVEETGEVRRFSQIVRGPQVAQAWQALSVAAGIPINETAVVRALEIHALYFAALWLHFSDDRLIPLDDSGSLRAMEVYTPEDVRRGLTDKLHGQPGGGLAPRMPLKRG